jgi:hypothetical protein
MRTLCVLLALSLGAAAQPTVENEAARARGLLRAAGWQEKAWGAYFAGRLHAAELQEPIIDAFREAAALRDATGPQERGYVAALFDAAIESEMTVPVEVLRPFEEKWSATVLILLARDADAEESLMRVRAAVWRGPEWLAAGNLLANLKSQRFFAQVLNEVRIIHLFGLCDAGFEAGFGQGSGGEVYDDGVVPVPKEFPPIGVYVVLDRPERGDVLLAEGATNAYYRRMVGPNDGRAPVGASAGVDREVARNGYLAILNHTPVAAALALFHRQSTIYFKGDEDSRQQMDNALQAQEADIRAFLSSAQAHGMASLTGVRLKIEPEVHDMRTSRTGPAPTVAPREFVLQ